MAQLFSKSANLWFKLAALASVLGIAGVTVSGALLYRSPLWTRVNSPLAQPLPFSHQHHVDGLGIDCRYCHTTVETSAFAGLPPTQTCMTCHSQIWTNAPLLEPVRASYRENKPLHWKRVHDLPDFVYFDHSIHMQKGIGCVSCHGRVDKMPITWKQHDLQMRWCLECHNDPQNYAAKEPNVVANSAAVGAIPTLLLITNKPALIHDAVAHAGGPQLENCSTCHR